MHTAKTPQAGFKRQIVFRISADDWPLLEAAAAEHGSIQAAIIAGLHALQTSKAPATSSQPPATAREAAPAQSRPKPATPKTPEADPNEEIRAREAAKILGLKTGTISGYIRKGRLPGRYDGSPTWRGWVISRRAVDDYLAARGR